MPHKKIICNTQYHHSRYCNILVVVQPVHTDNDDADVDASEIDNWFSTASRRRRAQDRIGGVGDAPALGTPIPPTSIPCPLNTPIILHLSCFGSFPDKFRQSWVTGRRRGRGRVGDAPALGTWDRNQPPQWPVAC